MYYGLINKHNDKGGVGSSDLVSLLNLFDGEINLLLDPLRNIRWRHNDRRVDGLGVTTISR